VDAIKLDKSFVQSIDTDQLAHRLVQAMIGVAHGLGLKVVAEGVETEGQRDALLGAGCSLMQGFLFARPRPAAELEEFLSACNEPLQTETIVPNVVTNVVPTGVPWPVHLPASVHFNGRVIEASLA
jgi:sensor c-di-GMP phosphodiesterase-like protein